MVFVAGLPTCLRRVAARDVCDGSIVRCLWSVCLWYSSQKGNMKECYEHMYTRPLPPCPAEIQKMAWGDRDIKISNDA